MAAKVLMVAVPTTLLGLASIRVYGVNEAKMDELISPRQLGVYDPIPKAQQPQFFAEKTGVLESGLRSARETSLPYVNALQGALVSVKVGTVNLYHAGEDVYHFLCAPPPGFLVRMGTITMAGLVGMILARKGSRFKRVAVPLSLSAAGAVVCYPAQAVLLIKVSGKKFYAVSQWSGATVSSLLTSSPKDQGTSPSPQTQAPAESKSPAEEESVGQRPEALSNPVESDPVGTSSESQAVAAEELSEETQLAEEAATADAQIVKEAIVAEETHIVEGATTAESQTVGEATIKEEPVVDTQMEEPPVMEAMTLEEPPVVEATQIVEEDVITETQIVEEAVITETQRVEEAAITEESPVEAQAKEEAVITEESPLEAQAVITENTPVETQGVEDAVTTETQAVEEAVTTETQAVEEAVTTETQAVEEAVTTETQAVEEAMTTETQAVEEAAISEEPPALTDTPIEAPKQEADLDTSTGGSQFQPDPKLLDFGQSHPEDKDMYSTRS